MATDLREQILARLTILCQGIDGIKLVSRNAQDVQGLERPCIILHDGNEEIDDSVGRPDLRGRLQMQVMTPQFNVYFSTKTKEIGSVADTFRMRLLAAIFNDANDMTAGTLGSFLFDQELRYQGCTLVPPEVTESRETRLEVEVAFTYPFRVSDFTS